MLRARRLPGRPACCDATALRARRLPDCPAAARPRERPPVVSLYSTGQPARAAAALGAALLRAPGCAACHAVARPDADAHGVGDCPRLHALPEECRTAVRAALGSGLAARLDEVRELWGLDARLAAASASGRCARAPPQRSQPGAWPPGAWPSVCGCAEHRLACRGALMSPSVPGPAAGERAAMCAKRDGLFAGEKDPQRSSHRLAGGWTPLLLPERDARQIFRADTRAANLGGCHKAVSAVCCCSCRHGATPHHLGQ